MNNHNGKQPAGTKLQLIKYSPPPPGLPVYGRVNPQDVSFIGRTNYVAALEEKKFVFGIKRVDRKRHLYVIGKSGVGKSKLFELLIRQDVAYGKGLCLIDPHGDLIEAVLDFIPENRKGDVVVVNPGDMDFPVSFNPLSDVDPSFKHQLTQSFIEIMEKRFGANWSPRLEHVFRFTCLALLDYPDATMRGMISMLTDERYRQRVIEHIQDDMVKRFWAFEFSDWAARFDTDAIIPLVNKLSQFLSDPLLRNIFDQKKNKIKLDELIAQKKIILINLSKGRLGEENSGFFGSMFITKLKQAGMARALLPESQREDFYLYIEEFHNLVTGTFENLLSESRKYGFCMTIAHQYVGQVDPRVESTVLGNAGTLIVFRIGGDDAVKLKPELAPIFDVRDMINLGTREFYIKMTIEGETSDPFSAETLKIFAPPHASFKGEIVRLSRENFAIPVEEARRLISTGPQNSQ
jgi:type IV secretory pathway TraG/TraD family ATPase VirD4